MESLPNQNNSQNEKLLSSEKAEEIIVDVKEALQIQITEDKDLKSLARYLLIRPFRGIPYTSNNLQSILADSKVAIQDFCKNTGEAYPVGEEAKQTLLKKLDSLEIREKIRQAYGQ